MSAAKKPYDQLSSHTKQDYIWKALINLQADKAAAFTFIEPEICTIFGCGRTLSDREKLFGKRCIHHSAKIK